ncbi:MAG: Tat pathway signal protein [Sphingomonadales bacterium]|nr:Tat pathway signal protein [Sphingomonadales bacterium]MDE2569192.1 Tat pathway signal protein [Sphingomonadales bacterium]
MAIRIERRTALRGAALGLGSALLDVTGYPAVARTLHRRERTLPPFFDDLEFRTFRFFWERANPKNGMVPDRWPTPSFASIAAIGFALTAYPIGVERGWITRAAARERTLTTLRFMAVLPSGEGKEGIAGYKGFFYHFLDMETGLRFRQTELSTVDSALLFMGMLFAAGWFDADHADEREIRRLATDIVERAEWNWFQHAGPAIPMGWHPESGFITRNWDGYNEGKLVYILALGARRHPAMDGSWAAWTTPYPRFWRDKGPTRHLAFAPLFGHQYSETWIDFRGIRDAPMRAAGFDYFENSRRETYANRAWCASNPMGWDGYGNDVWGLTACDGPGDFTLARGGREAKFRGYSARGPEDEPDGFDDGTIAPTAALGALPFAPEICIPAAFAMHREHGMRIYGEYGFRDSFNPSFRDAALKVATGTVDPVHGWVATDWLGIDQGPILGMLANYRTEAIWRVMRRSSTIVRGLKRAGFTGGWLGR